MTLTQFTEELKTNFDKNGYEVIKLDKTERILNSYALISKWTGGTQYILIINNDFHIHNIISVFGYIDGETMIRIEDIVKESREWKRI